MHHGVGGHQAGYAILCLRSTLYNQSTRFFMR